MVYIEDADVDAAVEGAIVAKFRNSGQTCVCANRIFVHSRVYDVFAQKLADRVQASFRLGHGLDPETTHGPLIHAKAVEKVTRHVQQAQSKGASVITGGSVVEGNFFQPTILRDAKDDMEFTQEETFGPLAGLLRFETEEEVIQRANATPFGLAGYFYSRDIGRCWRVAEALQVGMVGVNSGLVSSEVAPFGGIKQSGIGREGTFALLLSLPS